MAALATASSTLAAASCVSRPSAVATTSATGLRLAPLPLGAGVGSSSFSAKTVSNGSRTNAFLVVNPNTNLRFETLSYLPPLTDRQIYKQVEFLIRKGLIPAIEFDTVSSVSKTNYAGPGYYDGRYFTLWKLPLFGANDPSQVLREVQEARRAYPESFIRVIGFDNIRQVQVVAFLVQKPSSFQSY